MMSRRFLIGGLCALALVASSCSDETSSSTTTSSTTTTAPSTTIAATTTIASTTTSSSTTTSPTSTSTSTTIAAVSGLGLSADGLGDALFGAGTDGVITYTLAILGLPTSDTGWVDPAAVGAACPGTEVRFLTWGDLVLFFSNDSVAASGLRHFASYQYGPAFGAAIDPYGLATDAGLAVGDTVADLQAIYPGALVNPADELSGASFFIEEGLSGFISGTSGTDVVESFVGGFGCGE